MNYRFLIINSMNELKKSFKSIIEIFSEYNIFRLETMFNYRPDIAKDIYGSNIDAQINAYKQSIISKEPYTGFFEFFINKFQNYFKYFLIQTEDNAIGQASIEKYADHIAILHRVYTRPAFRRMHYGSLLLEKIAQTAHEDGYSKIYLDTIPTLKAAIKMYEKFGFKFRDYYPAPYLSKETAHIMDTVFMEYSFPN